VQSTRSRQIRYLAALAGFVVLGLTPIISLNLLVDPLWYFSGTRIGAHNYWLNDRTSKINLIRQNPGAYDCLILGSSVTALLNPKNIEGYKCFNAAFSAATAEELRIYARYLKSIGVAPKLVIVDLGPADLRAKRPPAPEMPEFIVEGRPPAPALLAYLSFDVFWFSVRSALGMLERGSWYTPEFIVRQVPPKKPMTPAGALAATGYFDEFGQEALSVYAELLDIWPEARKIGYVSFVNAWVVTAWWEAGKLEAYLETVHAGSRLFDKFYDFSAPSGITADLSFTYDGLHFSESVNDLIAAQLSGRDSSLGLAVDEHSYSDFRDLFLRRIQTTPIEIVEYVMKQT
jgi:hypothetical protein